MENCCCTQVVNVCIQNQYDVGCDFFLYLDCSPVGSVTAINGTSKTHLISEVACSNPNLCFHNNFSVSFALKCFSKFIKKCKIIDHASKPFIKID